MANARDAAALDVFLDDSAAESLRYNVEEVAYGIWKYCSPVFQLNRVEPGDLQVKLTGQNRAPTTVDEAVRSGTKFFDALLFLLAKDNKEVKLLPQMAVTHKEVTDYVKFKNSTALVALQAAFIKANPGAKTGDAGFPTEVPKKDRVENADVTYTTIYGDANVAAAKESVAYVALYVMLRGNYPTSSTANPGSDVPAFLINIMKFDKAPIHYAEKAASFVLKKIDPAWIKHIPWNEAGVEVKNRLALGLPGYRLFQPFQHFMPRKPISAEALCALNWVREFNRYPMDWGMFPLTRSHTVIQKLGSVNGLLAHLITEVFDQEQINEMLNTKYLSVPPQSNPRYAKFSNLPIYADLGLKDPIVALGPAITGTAVPLTLDDIKANYISHMRGKSKQAEWDTEVSKMDSAARVASGERLSDAEWEIALKFRQVEPKDAARLKISAAGTA